MSEEFKPITIESQEQLDGMFKDRLSRQNEKHAREIEDLKAQYVGFEEMKAKNNEYEAKVSDLTAQLAAANDKIGSFDTLLAEKDNKIKGFEVQSLKQQIAINAGLSLEAVEFLRGETEEEIQESADKLQKLTPKQIAPLANNNGGGDSDIAAFKTMLADLTN